MSAALPLAVDVKITSSALIVALADGREVSLLTSPTPGPIQATVVSANYHALHSIRLRDPGSRCSAAA